MKRLLAASLALALSACAGMIGTDPVSAPAPATTGVIAKADTVILTGERGFAAAELAYITAADGVAKLADAGVIRGATATTVRGWNAQARALLVRGKATADTAEKARDAAALFGFADKLNALIGGK